jgi:branched-chain amino acid aminotransferase
MKMATVWLNDEFLDEDAASISVRDTGLLHAAGVFTTMRGYAGKVFRLQRHLARLRASCEALFIPLQYKDEQLASAVDGLLERNNLTDARLRLTVTRGMAKQDPLHGLHLTPTVLLTATELEGYPPEFYTRGMTAVVVDDQKLNPYDAQAGHKTLNYFSRLFALREANRRAAGEALWFNVHNYLQSGSVSNVFVFKAGRLTTPPTNDDLRDPAIAATCPYPRAAVLPGITRATVIEFALSAGIEVAIQAINITELLEADEVFLTNSITQVMPVCRIERSTIGDDKPGRVTRQLADALAAAVRTETGSRS